jgi:hypothetical protein
MPSWSFGSCVEQASCWVGSTTARLILNAPHMAATSYSRHTTSAEPTAHAQLMHTSPRIWLCQLLQILLCAASCMHLKLNRDTGGLLGQKLLRHLGMVRLVS